MLIFVLQPTSLTDKYILSDSALKRWVKSRNFMNLGNVQSELTSINNILFGGKHGKRHKYRSRHHHIDTGLRGIGIRSDGRFVNLKTNHPIKAVGPTWNKIVKQTISPFKITRHKNPCTTFNQWRYRVTSIFIY